MLRAFLKKEHINSPWKISVSFKNQSNQVPLKPISVSSSNAPFWYIRGLCVNCARSMRENIIVSSNLTRTDRMRSNDNGSSPVMKLREGIFKTDRSNKYARDSIPTTDKFLKQKVAVRYVSVTNQFHAFLPYGH